MERSKSSETAFRVFVIAVIIIATVAMIVGILALLASKNVFPPNFESLNRLAVIGTINSGMILVGGVALVVIGVVAWICHLRKENQQLPDKHYQQITT